MSIINNQTKLPEAEVQMSTKSIINTKRIRSINPNEIPEFTQINKRLKLRTPPKTFPEILLLRPIEGTCQRKIRTEYSSAQTRVGYSKECLIEGDENEGEFTYNPLFDDHVPMIHLDDSDDEAEESEWQQFEREDEENDPSSPDSPDWRWSPVAGETQIKYVSYAPTPLIDLTSSSSDDFDYYSPVTDISDQPSPSDDNHSFSSYSSNYSSFN